MVNPDKHHVIRYRASRSQVWRHYWALWRAKLWRVHVVSSVVVGYFVASSWMGAFEFSYWGLSSVVMFSMIVAIFALIPQVMFKTSERYLRLDKAGWSSTIGRKSGSRSWAEVASVAEQEGALIIQGRNGNALVIPATAFSGEEQRNEILRDISMWKTAT